MMRIPTLKRRAEQEYRPPADRIAVTVFGLALATFGVILGVWALLTLGGCDLWLDTTEVKVSKGDAGVTDAGGTVTPSDGGVDAGGVDAGDVDAGGVDAGDVDAGGVDAGAVDAGVVDAGGTVTVSYAATVQPILANYCGSCHSGSSPQAGLDVTTFATLVTAHLEHNIVVPGDPAASVLVQRIENGTMPPGGLSLSTTEINAIKAWITSGAPNN